MAVVLVLIRKAPGLVIVNWMLTPQSCSKPKFSAPTASRLLLFQLFFCCCFDSDTKPSLAWNFKFATIPIFLPESHFFKIFANFMQKYDGIHFAKLKNELEIPWLIRLSCLMTGFITIQLHFYATLAYFVYFWYCVTTSNTNLLTRHKTFPFLFSGSIQAMSKNWTLVVAQWSSARFKTKRPWVRIRPGAGIFFLFLSSQCSILITGTFWWRKPIDNPRKNEPNG